MQVHYETIKTLMDDGFIFWLLKLNSENFKTCLNNMHASIKLRLEKSEIVYESEKKV